MALISAFAFVCQNLLTERDGVSSAIRIVEIFFLPKVSDEERTLLPPVSMSLYAHIRLTEDDDEPHSLHMVLIRPGGERHAIPVFEDRPLQEGKVPNVDRTVNATGQIAVEPKQLGRHEFAVELDGKKVASAYFTLVDSQNPNAETPPIEPPPGNPN